MRNEYGHTDNDVYFNSHGEGEWISATLEPGLLRLRLWTGGDRSKSEVKKSVTLEGDEVFVFLREIINTFKRGGERR